MIWWWAAEHITQTSKKKKIIKMASAPFVIVNAIDIFRNCYKADPFIKCPSVHKKMYYYPEVPYGSSEAAGQVRVCEKTLYSGYGRYIAQNEGKNK